MSKFENVELRSQWTNMISGKEVDENVVRSFVYESWKRSLKAGIKPFNFNKSIFLEHEEMLSLCNCMNTPLHENLAQMFKQIAIEMKLSILMYDKNCNINCIFAVADEQKSIIPRNLSENIFGTNAVCLALELDRPVQLLAEEHFCYIDGYCTAAPIHSLDGKIDRILNIASFSQNQNNILETLGLVTSIAHIIENGLQMNRVLSELKTSYNILNNIIENDSSGIVYVSDIDNIKYNRSMLNILEIKDMNNQQIVLNKLQNVLMQIDEYNGNKEIDNKEIFLNINNKQKSFLVTMKKINTDTVEKGFLIRFEDTNKLLKIKMKHSKAIYTFENIIGENIEIKKVKEIAKKAARTSSAILIIGESGTGKELFAQSIHNESLRKDKPFIAINCGAIPSELIESELFGYEPGSFTGASKSTKIGMLEAASEGTIFFDEIESMPLNVQVKLLRALSENKISRIGSVDEIPIDIRIISATKNDLLVEAEKGNFREDLYFRINVISINLPPLRERKDDIFLIARDFIKYYAKIADLENMESDLEFMEALTYYYWRGNVRELKNVIEKAVLLNESDKLTVKNLPPKILKSYSYKSLKEKVENKIIYDKKDSNILKTSEEMTIEIILKEENYNLTKTAKRLGISRTTLYKKIKEMPKLKKCKDIEQCKEA